MINENGSGISYGFGITNGFGIENSCGINECKYIKDCKGLSNSIMCIGMSGIYKLFNKDITKKYYLEISNDINDIIDDWYPKFTNAFDLKEKNGNKWKSTPVPKIEGVTAKEAYKDMPQELIDYFKSLPEYDEKIFNEITGRN